MLKASPVRRQRSRARLSCFLSHIDPMAKHELRRSYERMMHVSTEGRVGPGHNTCPDESPVGRMRTCAHTIFPSSGKKLLHEAAKVSTSSSPRPLSADSSTTPAIRGWPAP